MLGLLALRRRSIHAAPVDYSTREESAGLVFSLKLGIIGAADEFERAGGIGRQGR
jgi:hypothetical protein